MRGGWVGDDSVPVNLFGRSPFAQVFGYDFVEYFLSEIFRSFMEASRQGLRWSSLGSFGDGRYGNSEGGE